MSPESTGKHTRQSTLEKLMRAQNQSSAKLMCKIKCRPNPGFVEEETSNEGPSSPQKLEIHPGFFCVPKNVLWSASHANSPITMAWMLLLGVFHIETLLKSNICELMAVSGKTDPLDFLTNEELLVFLHRKKTEISCIEQPHAFLTQLRDHDVMPEDLFERMKGTCNREEKQERVYEVLDQLEKEKSQCMHHFWRCLFEDHILQRYPTFQRLRNSLLDGFFDELYENSPDVETWMEKSGGTGEKGKERKNTRKRNKDDRSGEDSGDPGPSSVSTRTRQKQAKKLSFCTFEFYENSSDVETQTEKSGGTGKKGKRKNSRKRNKDDRIDEDSGDPGPSSASTPTRKKPAKKLSFSSPEISDKQELPVNCGDKEGTFYWHKLNEGEECILSQGRWFTPSAFEKFGGKERCKNWKVSIRFGNIPFKKLIEDTHHQSPPMERRKRTCAPKEEMTDLSVFGAPSLPVICVSLTGTLYKDRFASGSRGKSIRTEESWFTPEEFVKQESSLTDGHWKKDILCHGKTLNFLVKEVILRIHSACCECVKCSDELEDLVAQKNDDVCYVCDSEGDLVCCDKCPRAFHSHCHLPAVDGDSAGEWICTFCVFRTSQQWRVSSSMTEQEAFDAPVSRFKLHCYHLLLCVYREDTQRVFVKDPYQTVSRYFQFIAQPMWLDRIKLKLESDEYQTVREFVSDFQLIFSNCSTFNRDNKFGQMGAKLKEMFEKEFQKIFTIQ